MPDRLKMKDEFRYRKARKRDGRCEECINSILMKIYGISNANLGLQYRCRHFGLGSSVRYRIQPGNTCDKMTGRKEET